MKLLVLMMICALSISLNAGTQSDWYSGLTSKKSLSRLSVGDEMVWVDDVALPYRFSHSGAVLYSTLDGYRLDLSGVGITGYHWSSGNRGIWADGDISIFLQGRNTITVDGSSKTGVYSQGSVLVFGEGALSIISANRDHYGTGIGASQDVTIGVGASVTITGAAKGIDVWSGDVLLNLCTVGIYGIDYGSIHSENGSINILGSAVSMIAGEGLTVAKGIVIDGSIVDMLVSDVGVSTESFSATHSYLSWVSTGKSALLSSYETFASHKWETAFDNCVVRFASSDSECIYADILTLGEGDYTFATAMDPGTEPFASSRNEFRSTAISAAEVNVCGGNVCLCAPGVKGIYARDVFTMDRGRVEFLRSVDVRDMLLFDVALAATYGITSSQIGFSSWSANFYAQVSNDIITNAKLATIDGEALAGIFAPYDYAQNGGTIWCDNATWGVVAMSPLVNGGSYKGAFYKADFNLGEVTQLPSPSSTVGDSLMCRTYTATGRKKYDKVEQSWAGILPDDYGTQSLYADDGGKLYFWLPASSGGDDSGGGVDPGGGDTPLPTGYCTIIFDANGGSVRETMRKVARGVAIGELPTPVRDGHEFLGWYTAADGGSEVSATTKVSSNVTYYAKWNSTFPDLRFTIPSASAWEAPMFISVATGDHRLVDTVVEGQKIYLSYAFQNFSKQTVTGFKNVFRLNNGVEFWQNWSSYDVKPLKTGGLEMAEVNALQGLPPGNYTLTCTLNDERTLEESDYSNNSYALTFTVLPRNSAKYDLGFAAWDGYNPWDVPLFLSATHSGNKAITSFTAGDFVYIKCGCKNLASTCDVTGFKIKASLSNGITFENDYFMTCVLGGGGVGVPQYWHPEELRKLPPGTYTLTVAIDSENAIRETDESNNSRSLTFTVKPEGDGGVKLHQDEAYGYSTMPYAAAAAVYDGYLYDANGVIAGSVQVKVAKMKNGEAKATATVQLADGSKKLSFKNGIADEYGNVTGMSASGHALAISLGVNGMGGSMDGNSVDGARNLFSAKDAASKATAAAIEKQWVGAINVVGDDVVLSVTIAKRGKVKVAGTVNGAKVSATSQLLVGDGCCCIPVVITKKANLAFNLWLNDDGEVVARGADSETSGGGAASPLWIAGKAGTLAGGAAFRMSAAALAQALPGLLAAYLPDCQVAQNGTKWVVAGGAKAGKLALVKGASNIDPAKSKFTDNMSGLKLTYKAKDGSFKGSFKAYNLENGKLKSYTVNVTGVMVGDTGYGTATVKKPAVSWPMEIR